jgi:Asp-tRNA(Asn)/Glu-tRNA(Gln) amidotransferase A subunit family amidase
MDFKNLSLIELAGLIKSGETTSDEIYNYFLERTKKYNGELNAFNTLPEQNHPYQGGI